MIDSVWLAHVIEFDGETYVLGVYRTEDAAAEALSAKGFDIESMSRRTRYGAIETCFIEQEEVIG